MVSAASKKFQRDFFIFSNEDSGYEDGNKPSGHVRLEVRDRKERLSAVIQNLRNGNGKFGYALYLIRTKDGAVEYVRAGEMKHFGSRAELELSFDRGCLEGTVYSLEDFDTFAVLTEIENRSGTGVVCPLAAYRSGRTDWRGGLRKAMQKKSEAAQVHLMSQLPEKPVLQPVYNTAEEPVSYSIDDYNHQHQQFGLSEQFEPEYGIWPKPVEEIAAEVLNQMANDGSQDKAYSQPEEYSQENANVQPEEYSQEDANIQPEEYSQDEVNSQPEPAILDETAGNTAQGYQSESTDTTQTDTGNAENQTAAQAVQRPPGIDYKYPAGSNNLNTECVYLMGNICGAVLNAGTAADPCGACRVKRRETPAPMYQTGGNLIGLEEELYKSFDICDPFHSRRSDYIWWRVTNPVNLNNMFYQNNIRSPLMFNPAVMMAHYKYKHLIVGIFTHKTGQRYIVCGVPGMHMVDSKPFGDISKWVQAEGSRQRYGAFGYWLLYINPEDGKIIHS